MNEELLLEIAKQYRKKYNHVIEIRRLTGELGDALSRNDKVSAQLLLSMRGEEMTGADGCERNIRLLIENAGIQDREQLECLLSENIEPKPETGLSAKENQLISQITDIKNKIKGILKETIDADKHVSRKLAGEESFYKK